MQSIYRILNRQSSLLTISPPVKTFETRRKLFDTYSAAAPLLLRRTILRPDGSANCCLLQVMNVSLMRRKSRRAAAEQVSKSFRRVSNVFHTPVVALSGGWISGCKVVRGSVVVTLSVTVVLVGSVA